jgi:alginate O-acetyltransferase complex protein AlgI
VDAARTGLLLVAWGYLKKLVVADTAGVVANKVLALAAPSFPLLCAGVFAFGLQIYADFSGARPARSARPRAEGTGPRTWRRR